MNAVSQFQSYIVCTSPRSGSTLLCRLLAATGKSGIPDSHFHSSSISDWMGYYDLTTDKTKTERDVLVDIFREARSRGTGNTGIFGLRLQRQSCDFFMQKLQVLVPDHASDHERIQQVFGRTLFIHLTRQNKLEQAISYVIAAQSGLWHKAPNGQELERLSAPQDIHYDANAIQQHLMKLGDMDERWKSWFAKENLTPLRINYEDLSDDPLAVTGGILQHLGLDKELVFGTELPVAKLADATSRQWAKRFRADNGS